MNKLINKKLIRLVFCVIFIIAICTSMSLVTIKAYDLGAFYFVDSGKHLDYSGSTKYQWQEAITVWHSGGYNIVRKKAWNNIKDLEIGDYSNDQSYFMAIILPDPIKGDGTGRQNGILQFNTAYIDKLSSTAQQSFVIRHLGYALGLMDNTTDSTSVMSVNGNSLKLSRDDIDGLKYLYKNVY